MSIQPRVPRFFSWADDGTKFSYSLEGKQMQFHLGTGKSEPATGSFGGGRRRFPFQMPPPGRGEQYAEAYSPNGKWKAQSKDGNVFLSPAKSGDMIQVTDESTPTNRIKFGIASWVYGEELGVKNAMWFSPNSKLLAFYRYDESAVKDYYIAYSQLKLQDTLNTEPYPFPGEPNPAASLMVYDIAKKTTVSIDSKFGDPELGYYVFEVNWSPDGKELLYIRTNRLQNILEFCAADPVTGKSRVIVKDERHDGWVDTNRYSNLKPTWLADGHRFIWIDDQSGYRGLVLHDISGKVLAQLTHLNCDVEKILAIDEEHGWVYFTARNGDNPYLLQLNRVKLDGSGFERLTDPSLSHTCSVSPKGLGYIDTAQSRVVPPTVTVHGPDGHQIAVLATGSLDAFDKAGLKKAIPFNVKAADGTTDLYGWLEVPSDFDPNKKYPMVCQQYGGPEAGGAAETFAVPNPLTEFGFVLMHVDDRGSSGRGRAFMCAVYKKLGQVEIDDNATVIKELCAKYSFLDPKRVGIEGTSYGGYFAAISILRYPDVYAAACACSPVTDFRLYDSIYTERYMGLPTADDNLAGYEKGSCMTYANDLKGRLMLYFGSADNNVHPANTFRLAKALTEAGKRYDMMVGPDRGHSAMDYAQEWEYFIRNLILNQSADALNDAYATNRSRLGSLIADFKSEVTAAAKAKKREAANNKAV